MITVLVDDQRNFTDGREAIVCRTWQEGIDALTKLDHVDDLWLDHDLGANGTAMHVVNWLEEAAVLNEPYSVDRIWVHTANPGARETMLRCLRARGYDAQAINADWEGILIGS